MPRTDPISASWRLSEALRQAAPLIHNLTNLVMQNDTADAIGAVGATQVTLHSLEEARTVAALCAALAVNTGTLEDAWLAAVRAALEVAAERRTPWVLDPVAVGFTRYRTEAVRDLMGFGPAVIKGNASEILVLAGAADGGRGADSIHGVAAAGPAARELARRHGCTVVVSGDVDLITDGERLVRIANGAPIMGRMIGSGCMLSAVVGCYLAVSEDAFAAAQAAVTHFTVAGEIAAEQAQGPGTLKPLLIDALHSLDFDQYGTRARILGE